MILIKKIILALGVVIIPNLAFCQKNQIGVLYVHDKEGQGRMSDVYNVPHYPSRFDLSINFGIGFNF